MTRTMLVWTSATSTPPGQRAAAALASRRARSWSSASRSTRSRASRPAAARMPTCRIAAPEALPFDARPRDEVGGTGQQRADRCPQPLRHAAGHRGGRRGPLRDRGARGHRRVPEASSVEVHRQPGGGHRLEALEGPDPSTHLAVGVLDEHGRRLGPPDAGVGDPAGHLARVDRAIGVVERHQLGGGVATGRARLADDHVLAAAHEHHRARRGEQPQGDLVGHRAGRHEQRRLLAHPLRERRLQAGDRRIVAEAVVADLGVGHRPAHLGRRSGDRVAAQVDAAERDRARSEPSVGAMAPTPTPRSCAPSPNGSPDRPGGCCGRASAASGSRSGPRAPAPTWSPRWTEPRRRSSRPSSSRVRPDDGILGEEGAEPKRHEWRPLGRRSSRRHHQLPLRLPRLRRGDRRRGGGATRSRGRSTTSSATSCSAPTSVAAPRVTAPPSPRPTPPIWATRWWAPGSPTTRRAAAPRPRSSCTSSPTSATSDGKAPPPSTCARSRAAASTRTTSAGSRRGTSPREAWWPRRRASSSPTSPVVRRARTRCWLSPRGQRRPARAPVAGRPLTGADVIAPASLGAMGGDGRMDVIRSQRERHLNADRARHPSRP